MSDRINIIPVKNKKQMKQFIMLPWTLKIYENDPAWVPPLISDQKQFFDHKKGYFFEIGEAEFENCKKFFKKEAPAITN